MAYVDQMHLNLLFLIKIFLFIWCLVVKGPRHNNSLAECVCFLFLDQKNL